MGSDVGAGRPDVSDHVPGAYCSSCVYAERMLERETFRADGPCGLDCRFDDELCRELRTDNCSMRRKSPIP